MQKLIEFYDNKGIDLLEFGVTLPNLASNCSHKSIDSSFYLFTETDNDFLEKIREDMVVGPFRVFTRKVVVDETCIRKSTNLCKTFVGINDSQPIPTQCVSQSRLVYILDRNTVLKPNASHHTKTNPARSRKWISHFSKQLD